MTAIGYPLEGPETDQISTQEFPEGVDMEPRDKALLELITFREATVEDLHFIQKSWLRTERHSFSDMCPSPVFYTEMTARIARIAQHAQCIIATDKEYAFFIYGFMVGRLLESGGLILHYAYVKEEWRGKGVAKSMAKAFGYKGDQRLFITNEPKKLNSKRYKRLNMLYNPFILEKMLVDDERP